MNVKEITDLAILHANVDISAIEARRWLNDAMRNYLAIEYDTARYIVYATITCSDIQAYYALDSFTRDSTSYSGEILLGVTKVQDSDGEKYYDYIVDGNEIKFEALDTYTVTCQIPPVEVTTVQTYTPVIHQAYHEAISKHIAAKELVQRDPERSLQLTQEFRQDALRINKALNRRKRKHLKIRQRRWY